MTFKNKILQIAWSAAELRTFFSHSGNSFSFFPHFNTNTASTLHKKVCFILKYAINTFIDCYNSQNAISMTHWQSSPKVRIDQSCLIKIHLLRKKWALLIKLKGKSSFILNYLTSLGPLINCVLSLKFLYRAFGFQNNISTTMFWFIFAIGSAKNNNPH